MAFENLTPSIVGRPAGVRDAGVHGGVVNAMNLGAIDRGLSKSIDFGLQLFKEHREEVDRTVTKNAFNNANREMDAFLNENIFSQQGLNAQDSVVRLDDKYNEILHRHGKDMNERQRSSYSAAMGQNYNSRRNQALAHQLRQVDMASAAANDAGLKEQMKILVQTGDDSGFPVAMAYLDDELKRRGVAMPEAALTEYEKKNKIEVDPGQSMADRVTAAAKDNPEYAKILKAHQYGIDQRRNYIDEVQLRRVDSMLKRGDIAGARRHIDAITSPGHPYAPSAGQARQLTEMLAYADRLSSEQRTADGYVAEALGGVSATHNFERLPEIEQRTISQIKNQHEGAERDRLVHRVKSELDDSRRLLIAERNRILRTAAADMAKLNATDAQKYIDENFPPEESGAPGAVPAAFRGEVENVYKARYGYLPEKDPIAANAVKMDLYQGMIDGSMVWNNQEVEINSKEDAYNMAALMGLNLPKYMREIDKVFDSRESRVAPRTINDQLERLGHKSKPGKTALQGNPGLYEWVNSLVPAGREKDTQAIQAAVSGYLVNQAMKSKFGLDKAMPLGQIKGNKKYYTAEQMNQMFDNWVQSRRANGKVPEWANSPSPASARRFAVEVLKLTPTDDGKEYWAPRDME